MWWFTHLTQNSGYRCRGSLWVPGQSCLQPVPQASQDYTQTLSQKNCAKKATSEDEMINLDFLIILSFLETGKCHVEELAKWAPNLVGGTVQCEIVGNASGHTEHCKFHNVSSPWGAEGFSCFHCPTIDLYIINNWGIGDYFQKY